MMQLAKHYYTPRPLANMNEEIKDEIKWTKDRWMNKIIDKQTKKGWRIVEPKKNKKKWVKFTSTKRVLIQICSDFDSHTRPAPNSKIRQTIW